MIPRRRIAFEFDDFETRGPTTSERIRKANSMADATAPAQQPPRKRSVLKIILIALVIILTAFVVLVAMQPDDYAVSRSQEIGAPPEVVFAQVNDFHNWKQWSPWGKLDPNMTETHEGAPAVRPLRLRDRGRRVRTHRGRVPRARPG